MEWVHVIDVQVPRAVAQDVIFTDRFPVITFGQLRWRPKRNHVRLQRPRRVVDKVVIVEFEILKVGDDRCTNVDVGAQTADVIKVLVGVDHESNGLVGNQLPHFFDDCEASLLIQRRLKNRAVIVELDGHAVVRSATQ